MTPRAIVSVHDVKPDTLDSVVAIVDRLERAGVGPVTLLVVPGVGWPAAPLETVRGLARRGCSLAGHGWRHRAVPPRGLFHRAHAAILSRDQAEHLSRPGEDLRRLVSRCHDWFDEVGLGVPELYVPPAWALGALRRSDLRSLPFRWYESLAGCTDAGTGVFRPMPLVGFEADTVTRAAALTVTNAVNRALARLRLDPLRIAIHPRDLNLRLAAALLRALDAGWTFTTVEAVMGARGAGAGPHAPAAG